MPNKIEEIDWLYRMVRPAHLLDNELSPDAFDDKYSAQSFNIARIALPCSMLENFARYSGTRKICKKNAAEADPTADEMYDAGYRIAVISVRLLRENQLEIEPEANGDEYQSDTGHVNVIEARRKAATLASNAYILTREEMQTGFIPSVSEHEERA